MSLQLFYHLPDHFKHHFLDMVVVGMGGGASIISIMGIINPLLTALVLALTIILTIMRIIALLDEKKIKKDDE